MKNKAYDLSTYTFSSGEKILVDTNVWFYLFPALRNQSIKYAKTYTIAFNSLVNARAQPILEPIVLSEYLNRYVRMVKEGKRRSRNPSFKQFRESSEFPKIASIAEAYTDQILAYCQVHAIPANQLDLNRALADFLAGSTDFNDALLVDICKKGGFKLMTNDGDFKTGGIEVLTTNPRLLRACR